MEWKATERLRSPYYRKAEKAFYEALMTQLNPVIKAAAARGEISAAQVERMIIEDPIWDKFEYVYKDAGGDFARRTYRAFMGAGVARQQFDDAMRKYVLQNCAEKVTSITNVTRTTAKDIIRTAIADNPTAGSNELSRILRSRLYDEGSTMSGWRSRMIAKTEVATASNVGQQIAAEETGLPMVKIWRHSRGADARVSHQLMDGQRADLEGFFILEDGTRLYTPCDPSGPPEHVINCRCSLDHKVRK